LPLAACAIAMPFRGKPSRRGNAKRNTPSRPTGRRQGGSGRPHGCLAIPLS